MLPSFQTASVNHNKPDSGIHNDSGESGNALDAVNDKWGKKTLILASEGFKQPFATKADMRSPRYMTRLADLPIVRA